MLFQKVFSINGIGMGHHHDHEHHHDHHHPNLTGGRLLITIILNVIITISQVIGGLISGSLALLSDALHNFSDVMALIIVYIANRIAQRKANVDKTFGYKRAELLAALFNSAVLVGIGVMLIFEAIDCFFNPQEVIGVWVIWLALLSVILNWVSVMLIAKDSEHNTNVRAAYLHLLSDTMTSVGVLISGLMIVFFEITWIDPLMTIIIAIYLIYASWELLKKASAMLMLFTPEDIEVTKLVEEIRQFDAIENVHHIHVWQLDDYEIHLEAHLDFKEDLPLSEVTTIVIEIENHIRTVCRINHFNFQTEFGRDDSKELIPQD